MSKDKYLFATGAIREAERRLISEGDMERMIDAPDAEQGFKVFNDLSYVDELLEISRPDRFVDVLTHDLGQVKDFIASMIESEDLLKLLFAIDDFYNLKLIFKARTSGQDIGADLSSLGHVEASKFKGYILDDNMTLCLGKDYEDIISLAKDHINDKSQPQEIDTYLEKEYFVFIQKLAQRIKSTRIKSIIISQIDSANIKIVFRSHLLGRSREETLASLISGGHFDISELSAYAELDEADTINKLSHKMTDATTVAGLNSLAENFELWRLEKILDDQILRITKEIKMAMAGPAVVYAYYYGKRNAIKNISTIMTGKLNLINTAEIKDRIRDLY